MRKRRWLLLLLLLAASIGILWLKQLIFKDSSVDNTPKPQPLPKAETQTPPPENKKATDKQPAQGRMELPPDIKTNYESSPREENYGETMRRTPDTGVKVTPGVTFEPGKGISLQKPGSDERVQIRRDNTYHTDEVKVLWEKKF